MKSNLILAGMLISSTSAMATADTVPAICQSVANYAAQTLAQTFTDGTWADSHSPQSIQLNEDFKNFPIINQKFVGNCDENPTAVQQSWCNVAGGSPDVYQMDVQQTYGTNTAYPFATVTVTYNRGGCWVDQIQRK